MQTVYSKLTLVSIDKHRYSKSKYSQTSAQATLSSKEPQCPQTSSGTATGHRDTCPMPTGIISLLSKDSLGFICCILERKSRGWDAWEVWLWWPVVFCPHCWTHTRRTNTTHSSLASVTFSLASTHHPQLWCCTSCSRFTSSPTLLYTHLLH